MLGMKYKFYSVLFNCVNLPVCGAENVSLIVSAELLGFTSSEGLLSIILYGGGGVSARIAGNRRLPHVDSSVLLGL